MRRIVLLTAAMVMASMMGLVGLAGSAGAAAPSTHALVSRSTHGLVITTVTSAAKKKAPPNADINAGPVFSPTSITGKKYPKSICKSKTAKEASFTISNLSGSAQDLDYTATATGSVPKDFGTIPPGDYVGLCAYGKFAATPLLQLVSNTSSVLTVTIT
jgi:hypothetical protein